MAEEANSKESSGKSFFTTLPGIITATAGLITAIGGFILVLSKAGCMKNNSTTQVEKRVDDSDNQGVSETDDTTVNYQTPDKTLQNVSYSPTDINVILKGITFKITSANIVTLPKKDLVLTLKVKCINESKYEYHFYAYNMRIKLGDDKYASEPSSPSEAYQSIDANSFKNLEYNFKLPAGTSKFNLVISDEKEEMGYSTFTVK